MGSLSVSSHTRLVHWQVLLVAVSLFNVWCHPTTAQFVILTTSTPEGENALLSLCNTPPEVGVFAWYRGHSRDRNNMIAFFIKPLRHDIKGPAYSGRETVNSDGSLLIDNANMNDAVMYTIEAYPIGVEKVIRTGWLKVYERQLVVSLSASSYRLRDSKDSVVLTCNTNAPFIHWLHNGVSLQLNERMKVSKIHQSLTIDPVKREDAGTYKCEVYNPITSNESYPVVLNVMHKFK